MLLLLVSLLQSNLYASLEFDNTNDKVNCGTNDELWPDGVPVSISAWIKPAGLGEGSLGRICQRAVSAGDGPIFNMIATSTLQFRVDTDGATNLVKVSNNSSVTFNSWQHVMATWGGTLSSNDVSIFVNGVETGYKTNTGGQGNQVDNSAADFNIGNASDFTRTFSGQISEFAIWKEKLTSGDAAVLAGGVKGIPLTVKRGNLVGYWSLNDYYDLGIASGDKSIIDRAGNNHGRPEGLPVSMAEEKLGYQ